jgi:hypothetical protein
MSEAQPSEFRRFIGLALIVIGTLWLVLTGLCSAAFLISVWQGGDPPPRDEAVGMTLLVTVPSILMGGLIYSIGRSLRGKQ